MANKPKGVLYIGVTNNLIKRVYEHKNDLVPGFTERYRIHQLVYYEIGNSIDGAIKREKQIKKWKRDWKIRLINSFNPNWKDLYLGFYNND